MLTVYVFYLGIHVGQRPSPVERCVGCLLGGWAAFWADRFAMDMQAAIEEFSGAVQDNFKAWHEAILLVCMNP